MLIVGVDFGTTNVRIATWDNETPNVPPQSQTVASGDSKIMPSVIAFQRNLGGDATLIVGEEADVLEVRSEIQVIPNIKRWAMSSDSYMRWHMEARDEEWPTWWDPFNRSVNVWGKVFPVKDIIRDILAKAIENANRAGARIEGNFEWRAGCPVHAGLDYRSDLALAIKELAGQGSISWVVEEPLLLLALGYHELSSPKGSYLVYDLGGGSFDSAMAEIHAKDDSDADDRGELVIYGADGHPRIGGADIDKLLEVDLISQGFGGSQTDIRVAKESLSPNTPIRNLDGISLSWSDMETALSKGSFLQKTAMTTRDAYVSAKGLTDELLEQYVDTGEVKFVWQLSYKDIAKEVDNIILYGGAIRAGDGYFVEKLKKVFGEKAKTASEWLIEIGIRDAELLGISLGACYFADKDYFIGKGFSAFVNRLPVRITLENLTTGESVGYDPFDNLTPPDKPFSEFATRALLQDRDDPQEYELTATGLDGEVIRHIPVDGYLEPENRHPATSLRMIINRFGQVWVEKRAEGIGLPWVKTSLVVDEPPWQLELPRGPVGEGVIIKIRDPEYYQRRARNRTTNEDWRQGLKEMR